MQAQAEKTTEVDVDKVGFQKSMFAAKSRTFGGLTPTERKILGKHPMDRTEVEVKALRDTVNKLICFRKYSQYIKKDLARVVCFEQYDRGRVLIKQGHQAHNFYFIVKGSVSILVTEPGFDVGDVRHTEVIGKMGEGSSFGDLELIHNLPRAATYIVADDRSEFLRVEKEDFIEILQTSSEREVTSKMAILYSLDFTRSWDHGELVQLCTHCRIIEFPPHRIIFGNTSEPASQIYYVVKGTCRVVKEVYIVRTNHQYGTEAFRLATEEDMLLGKKTKTTPGRGYRVKTEKLERHLWTVCTFSKGEETKKL